MPQKLQLFITVQVKLGISKRRGVFQSKVGYGVSSGLFVAALGGLLLGLQCRLLDLLVMAGLCRAAGLLMLHVEM